MSSPKNTPNRTDGSDTAQRQLRALDAPTADAISVTRTVTGNAVLARIGDVLADLLPYVPREDAFRFDLEALAAVAGCSPRALRAPLRLAGADLATPSPASGIDLLEALTALLDERLPAIALTDPAREHLVRFRAAVGPMHLALRAVQPEVRR